MGSAAARGCARPVLAIIADLCYSCQLCSLEEHSVSNAAFSVWAPSLLHLAAVEVWLAAAVPA